MDGSEGPPNPPSPPPPHPGPASPRGQRRFVAGVLAGSISLLACIGAFNALVDPFGFVGSAVFPTAILSDRATKACLAERLPAGPQLVVYGSSRAMKVDPAFVSRLTGLTSFNAAVSSATPADVWAFANFLHDRFPGGRRRVIWLLDVESFRARPLDPGLLETPALSRYFSASARVGARIDSFWSLLSWKAAHDAFRVVTSRKASATTPVPCTYRTNGVTEYAPNGLRQWDFHDLAQARGTSLATGIGQSIAQYRTIYASGYERLAPTHQRWFERTLDVMHAWGIRPVIVLTPVQPKLLRVIGPLGWQRRHAEVVRFLHAVAKRTPFELLDASRVATFGGSRRAFYDGVHMTAPNARRLTAWLVGRSRGTLSAR
ncbi:MAG: hypothetical protein QOE87_45 [Gaiellales bacterium]|nr:hypothetical protein [Gaiellales bacterium]